MQNTIVRVRFAPKPIVAEKTIGYDSDTNTEDGCHAPPADSSKNVVIHGGGRVSAALPPQAAPVRRGDELDDEDTDEFRRDVLRCCGGESMSVDNVFTPLESDP